MKKISLFITACMLVSFMGYSQNIPVEKVPGPVRDSFAKKFPSAVGVTYAMELKDYEVTFKDNGVGKSANFNSKGEWLETETVMIESDLPKDVLTSVATNYVGFLMTDITKTEGPGNVDNYEMVLTKGKEVVEVKISPKGEILKKTPVPARK
jgi:hypothetical protein